MDPVAGGELPPGGGRHQRAARAADHLPDAAGDPVLVDVGRVAVEGVRDHHAAAGGGDARGLRGPRPLPLLRLLGGDADPDVPHHRDLGRTQPDLRGGQVHPLYAGRLAPDAGRHPGPLLPARRGHQRLHLRPAGARALRAAGRAGAGPDVLRLRARVRDQGADVPVPHVAARRPRGGAHRGQRDPGRRAPEDGHLRLPPLLPAAVSGREPPLRAVDVRALGGRHHLRGVGLHRAARHQEAGGLFQREPPGLRGPRALHPHRAGDGGRPASRW